MNKHLFCIMIAEPDHAFRRKLKATFHNVEATLPAVKFNFIEPRDADDLLHEMHDKKPEMLFINADILHAEQKKLLAALRSKKMKHQLIMIIAERSNDAKEVTASLEKGRPVYLSGGIRKDNFSFELMTILIRFFVRRATSEQK